MVTINKDIRIEKILLNGNTIEINKKLSGFYPKSEEHRKKLSEANKGQIPWNTGIKGKELFSHYKIGKVWNNGVKGYKIHSQEHKEYLRNNMTGNKFREGLIPWNKGKINEYKLGLSTDDKKKKITQSLKEFYKTKEGIKKRQDMGKIFKIVRAKQVLPMKDSSIEVKIQNFLKELHIEFFTHQYRNEIKHSYQCDVFIPSMKLVIECDGDYWHKYPVGKDIDHIRTKELIEKGFKVLRLWEKEIKIMDINKFRERLNNMENNN